MNRAEAHAEIDRLFDECGNDAMSVLVIGMDIFHVAEVYGHDEVDEWKEKGALAKSMDVICSCIKDKIDNDGLLLGWIEYAADKLSDD